jgi:hypothetical protein
VATTRQNRTGNQGTSHGTGQSTSSQGGNNLAVARTQKIDIRPRVVQAPEAVAAAEVIEVWAAQLTFAEHPTEAPEETDDYIPFSTLEPVALFPPAQVEPIETFAAQPHYGEYLFLDTPDADWFEQEYVVDSETAELLFNEGPLFSDSLTPTLYPSGSEDVANLFEWDIHWPWEQISDQSEIELLNEGPVATNVTHAAQYPMGDDQVTNLHDFAPFWPWETISDQSEIILLNDGPVFPDALIGNLYSTIDQVTPEQDDVWSFWAEDLASTLDDTTAFFNQPAPTVTAGEQAAITSPGGSDDVAALFPDTVDWTEWFNDSQTTLDTWAILAPPDASIAAQFPMGSGMLPDGFDWGEFSVEGWNETTLDDTAPYLFPSVPPPIAVVRVPSGREQIPFWSIRPKWSAQNIGVRGSGWPEP